MARQVFVVDSSLMTTSPTAVWLTGAALVTVLILATTSHARSKGSCTAVILSGDLQPHVFPLLWPAMLTDPGSIPPSARSVDGVWDSCAKCGDVYKPPHAHHCRYNAKQGLKQPST